MSETADTAALPLPLFRLAGTPAEMGTAYGEQARDLIAANVEHYRRRFRVEGGLSADDIRDAGRGFRDRTHEYSPRIGEMLDSMAAASGVPVEDVYALNARTEMLSGAVSRPCADGCTALVALPELTASGHTLLGQNWDWQPELAGTTVLLATTDERGHRILTMAEAGMLAKCGLNDAGLGVTVNILHSDADSTGPGVPYHVLVRGVLESRTMGHAIRAAVAPDRSSSINLVLADAAGEAIDLEIHPRGFGQLLPEGGLLAHANHFDTSQPVIDTGVASSYLTLLRPRRVLRAVAADVERRRVSVDSFRTAFRDHYGFPHGVCRHLEDGAAPADKGLTVFSVVMDLYDGRFEIAGGPPCQHDYVGVRLDELSDTRAAAVAGAS